MASDPAAPAPTGTTGSKGLLAIGSDHAGFALKEQLKAALTRMGVPFEDLGTYSESSTDYADYAHAVASAVASGRALRGLLVCGSGIGMSMAANRHPGVRAALCTESYAARMSRLHNDANVLCLGARIVGPGVAEEILRAFLAEGFEGGRHAARVAKIDSGTGR